MAARTMSPSSKQEAEWRAADDASVLRRAQEIQADKTRHAKARQHAAKEMAALQKVVKAPARRTRSK